MRYENKQQKRDEIKEQKRRKEQREAKRNWG